MKLNEEKYTVLLAVLSLFVLVVIYIDANLLPEKHSEELVLQKWYVQKVSLKFSRNRTNYFVKTEKNTYPISAETYYSFRTNDYIIVNKSCIVNSFLGLTVPEKSIRFNEGIYIHNNGGLKLLLINALFIVGVFIFKRWLTVTGGRRRLIIFFSIFAILQFVVYLIR